MPDLQRRRNAEQSLWAFSHIYCSHFFQQPCGDLQKSLCHALETALLPPPAPGENRMLIGALPREHSKTTFGTTLVSIYAACKRIKSKVIRSRETIGPYIVIWSATEREAKEKLEDIKAEFENNKDLREDYGAQILPAKDASGAYIRYNDLGIILNNGAIIESRVFKTKARGFKYRGLRPTLYILDDPENDQDVENVKWRDDADKWISKALLNGLDSELGSLIYLGTILHYDSVLHRWLFPDKSSTRKGDHWRRLFVQAPDPDLPEGPDNKLVWPERWPMEKYKAKKAQIGSAAYEQEFRNNPVDSVNQDFKPEYWRYYDPDSFFMEGNTWYLRRPGTDKPERVGMVAMACDPAFMLDKKNDYTAMAVVALVKGSQFGKADKGDVATLRSNAELMIHVLGLWRDKTSVGGIIRQMERWYERFRPNQIGYEAGAAQHSSADQIISATMLPIKKIKPTGSKKERIRGLSQYFENRKILLPDPAKDPFTALFTKEAEQFPSGKNDDMLDALAMAVEMLRGSTGAGVDCDEIRETVGTMVGGF